MKMERICCDEYRLVGRARASRLAVSLCWFDKTLSSVKKQFPWANHVPAALVRFIGVSELLGGIGLIMPAVTHLLPWLTEAAAIGLALVMICAAIFHASRREFSMIGFNILLLLLAAFVVIGRLTLAPF